MKSILLVEDDSDMAEIITLILEDVGHKVTWASGGQQAIDIARDQTFDLVYLDISMPDMDGEVAGVQLMTIQPEIEVVICSSEIPARLARIAKKFHGRWLSKPFGRDELVASSNK